MQWQEIRDHYSQHWLLIKAICVHSEAKKRISDQIAVVNTYPDSVQAMRNYSLLHHDFPSRELSVLHTSREAIDITERTWLGVRGGQ